MDIRLALIFLTLAVLISWRWRSYRRQILWGGALTIPLVIANVLIARSLSDIDGSTIWALIRVATLCIGVASFGGLLAAVYELVVNRWLISLSSDRRHTLLWLGAGLGVSLVLALAHVPLALALIIGLLVDVVLVVIIDWRMLWDAIIGATGFAVWYAIADILFGFRVSGDISALLIGPRPIGLTIAGLAPERIIFMAGLGCLVAPLFVAIKRLRLPERSAANGVAHWKLVASAIVAVALSGFAAWITVVFIQTPHVVTMSPSFNAQGISATAPLTIHFSRPVNREDLQVSFAPAMTGTWAFSDPALITHGFQTATFTPDSDWIAGMTYTGTVFNIRSFWGQVGAKSPVRFTVADAAPVIPQPVVPVVTPAVIDVPVPTPVPVVPTPTPAPTPPVVVAAAPRHVELNVPLDYQDQPLSCEAAALKMALAAKGVKVSESQIMNIVGYDPTPHRGSVWGDPHSAFVGNIAGKQNTTGYGVYWEPIARAANTWRTTKIITNGTFADLTSAIDAGQAVVIWGTLGKAYRDDWTTPAGKKIVAWKGEHARTLIGYIGPAAHPTSFIINDPVVGRVTWSAATMRSNWSSFSNSAVIVQ